MEKHLVLFLDSGLGGIPYCRYFCRRNPGAPVVYLADRLHFPYGAREKKELVDIVVKLAARAIDAFDPQIIALACNTATIAALAELRERFPAPSFVGTVPAVKPAVLASKTGKIGVLGTELTVRESYITELAAQYGGSEVIGIAAPELVEFVERRFIFAGQEEKLQLARGYLDRFRAAGADVLVLGCTHFLFLQDEFKKEAGPDIAIFESIEGIAHRIESLLAQNNSPAPQRPCESYSGNRLLLTGAAAPEPAWVYWADQLGFELSLLGEA